MWQAEHVAARLASFEIKTELVPMVSGGDTDMRPIDAKRQVGVFTKRIQIALTDDEADLAVHSLKDLPTEVNQDLVLACVPQREIVFDALVSKQSWTLDQLPENATVGTGSKRRMAQLKYHRPDLNVQPIRGNVQTRLSKLEGGEFDAIVLAEAGLTRLEMHDLPRTRFSLEKMLPAPGQGALAIEVRRGDQQTYAAARLIEDFDTRIAVTAERRLLSELNGGCLAPIAAHASLNDGTLVMDAVVLAVDGTERLDVHGECAIERPSEGESDEQAIKSAVKLAMDLASELASKGARELIQNAR